MKLRPYLLSFVALGSLCISACSNTTAEDTSDPTSSAPATSSSMIPSATEPSPTVVDSTSETIPIVSTSPDPSPVPVLEPQTTTAPSASSTTWFPEPDSPFGAECFSGSSELWPANVDQSSGCRPVLDEQALAESLKLSIEVEVSVEPHAVECLFGTPGPTLMSDGSVQYTEDCYQQGISAPGYVNEGELVDRYWQCMDGGGETEVCREWAHSF